MEQAKGKIDIMRAFGVVGLQVGSANLHGIRSKAGGFGACSSSSGGGGNGSFSACVLLFVVH